MTRARPLDRRVARTRRALREAFVALVVERGWDAVSVQDVCERADVGRSTFYTHFADKEELVAGGLDDLRRALRAARGAPGAGADGGELFAFLPGLLEHAHEHRALFRAIVGRRGGQLIQARFRELVLRLVREDLEARPPGALPVGAAAAAVAGALLELMTWWLSVREPMPPVELERLARRLVAPMVAASRR
jgi:AcrR family transcriptional regulator